MSLNISPMFTRDPSLDLNIDRESNPEPILQIILLNFQMLRFILSVNFWLKTIFVCTNPTTYLHCAFVTLCLI